MYTIRCLINVNLEHSLQTEVINKHKMTSKNATPNQTPQNSDDDDDDDDDEIPIDHDDLFPDKNRDVNKLVKKKQKQGVYLNRRMAEQYEANKEKMYNKYGCISTKRYECFKINVYPLFSERELKVRSKNV